MSSIQTQPSVREMTKDLTYEEKLKVYALLQAISRQKHERRQAS